MTGRGGGGVGVQPHVGAPCGARQRFRGTFALLRIKLLLCGRGYVICPPSQGPQEITPYSSHRHHSQFPLFFLRLRMFPLPVHFVDIHDCQMARGAIVHMQRQSWVRMCPIRLNALSTWHADRGQPPHNDRGERILVVSMFLSGCSIPSSVGCAVPVGPNFGWGDFKGECCVIPPKIILRISGC